MTQFSELGLSAPILKALAAEGYAEATPIQSQAIPIVLQGGDLIGLAQTGTGKTAAFALPILERLAANRRPAGPRACRTLVLAPTRELAAQIAESFRVYGRNMGLSTTVVFGGVSMNKQRSAMERGVDILVATPGRLLDHVGSRAIMLDKVEILVLDEADHMMDMGFIHALKRIATLVPKKRQTLFFSATMPPPIKELAGQFLHQPSEVAVAPPSSTAERVDQVVIHIEQQRKPDLLHALLKEHSIDRAIIFTRTKHGADRVADRLLALGHRVEAIHGDKRQSQRERALEAFKAGKAKALVATEIAARGIDVDAVSHVINFDLPNVPEQYVHRIGRTARAGMEGKAISFCAPDERAYLKDIEKLTRQAVPVLEHALSLPTPQPGDRIPKPPARGGQQQSRKPQSQRAFTGTRDDRRTDDRPRQPDRAQHPRQDQTRSDQPRQARRRDEQAPAEQRAHAGENRSRKGQEVWSNAGPGAPRWQSKPPRTKR